MPLTAQPSPINLTEAAGHMPWSKVGDALRIRACADNARLEIQGLDHAEDGYPNDGYADTVYVVMSGYGVLRCGDMSLECTDGDVLFVPRGYPHFFERLDGEIRIWRISLAAVSAGAGDQG